MANSISPNNSSEKGKYDCDEEQGMYLTANEAAEAKLDSTAQRIKKVKVWTPYPKEKNNFRMGFVTPKATPMKPFESRVIPTPIAFKMPGYESSPYATPKTIRPTANSSRRHFGTSPDFTNP